MTERGTTGAGRPQITGVPRVYRTLRLDGRGTGNIIALFQTSGIRPLITQWNSPVDTTSSDPRQYGDGRDEVIPSFDGTDFRQSERRVRLFVSRTRLALERRAGKLLERVEGHAFDLSEGIQDWQTPKGVDILLDHLRRYFEPIDVSRQGGVLDDFVGRKSRSSRHGERRHALGGSSSSCFASECNLAPKTVRSVPWQSGRGSGRRE